MCTSAAILSSLHASYPREHIRDALKTFSRYPFSRWSALRHNLTFKRSPTLDIASAITLAAYLWLLYTGRRSSSEGENRVTRTRRSRVSLQRPRSFNQRRKQCALLILPPSSSRCSNHDSCNGAPDYPNKFLTLK